MSSAEPVSKDRKTILAEERTSMALRRTLIAADRTLMAWIRTALSMIGFGFSIYKFFQYMPEEIASGNIRRPGAPRNFGLSLIALGTVALATAAWQHVHLLNEFGGDQKRRRWSLALVVAVVVVLIGCIAFYGVLLRSGPF